jgi:hypothetical protein
MNHTQRLAEANDHVAREAFDMGERPILNRLGESGDYSKLVASQHIGWLVVHQF